MTLAGLMQTGITMCPVTRAGGEWTLGSSTQLRPKFVATNVWGFVTGTCYCICPARRRACEHRICFRIFFLYSLCHAGSSDFVALDLRVFLDTCATRSENFVLPNVVRDLGEHDEDGGGKKSGPGLAPRLSARSRPRKPLTPTFAFYHSSTFLTLGISRFWGYLLGFGRYLNSCFEPLRYWTYTSWICTHIEIWVCF